jgi:hypothetical protein
MADRIPLIIEGSSIREIPSADRLDVQGALEVNGDITPGTDSAYDIGTSSLKFRDIYLSAGTIHLGGVKLRADGNTLSIQDSTGASSGVATTSLATISTDDLSEGLTNLFTTAARTRSHIQVTDAGGDGSLTFDSASGLFTYTGPSAAEIRAHMNVVDAGGDGSFTYDSATGQFTYTGPSASEVRAHITANKGVSITSGEINVDSANIRGIFSAVDSGGDGAFSYEEDTGKFIYRGPSATEVRAHINVVDAGGDGSFTYDSALGKLTYTGPDATEVRAHFSAGEGIDLASGVISGEDATDVNKGIASFSSDHFDVTSGAVTIKADGIDDTHIDFGTGTNQVSTADIPEQTNLYYTDARADSDAKNAISLTFTGGDGAASYTPATGVISVTGPSAAEARAHFSGGNGVTITDGSVAIGQPVATTDSVTFAGMTVTGDLNVSGTTTSVNSISYTVNDPLIHLADSNEVADVVDIGFIGHYYRDGARRHAGLFRNADDQSFNLFNNMVDSAFDSALPPNVINTGATGYTLANLNAGTVTGTFVGNVTGNVTGSSGSTTGNAATATALQTGRTIGLSGDVTATGVSFDGTGNITLTTAMANNSVDLTTHTTGNYVQQGATSGNGISGSVNSEGGTFTVTSNATNANTGSTIVFRDGSGNFSAGTITAALSGNASTATSSTNSTNATNFNVAADNSTNATHYVIFTGGATGNQRPNSDTTLTYNPSSNTLSTTTFSGALSGNATTATTLQTARTIGGVSFNGSANINLPGVNTTGNQNTSGNAGSATVLQTARTIGGVSFNGSANINLPGVNTSGNQNTSGNAATATALATGRTISLTGDATGTSGSFNGTGNVSISVALAANTVSSTELVSASTLLIKNTAGTTIKTIIGAGS